MANFNPHNCEGRVRGEGRDVFGNRVLILGVHAFEYSVIVYKQSLEIIRRFPNGREARIYFAKITRKRY